MNQNDEPDDPPGAKLPGGVRHDEQGNAIWQWAGNTGRQMLDSTSRLLRKLEVPGLKLLDDKDALAPRKEKGFDPYAGHAPSKPPKAAPQPVRAQRPAPAAKKPSLLGRLFGRR